MVRSMTLLMGVLSLTSTTDSTCIHLTTDNFLYIPIISTYHTIKTAMIYTRVNVTFVICNYVVCLGAEFTNAGGTLGLMRSVLLCIHWT